MGRYKIFDPKQESLESLEKKLAVTKDLVTRCELAYYLRDPVFKQVERTLVIFSYCLSEIFNRLDQVLIVKDSTDPKVIEEYERKYTEVCEKLKRHTENPKETKTYAALLSSLTRQKAEYARLVEYGDVPKAEHKHLANLEILLKRLQECINTMSESGITCDQLAAAFPRLRRLLKESE